MSDKQLTLGDLKPGNVAVLIGSSGRYGNPFIVGGSNNDDVCCDFPGGFVEVNPIDSPVRLIAERGHIEPARIVIDGEPDVKDARIAELESQVQRLREVLSRLYAMNFGREDEYDPMPYDSWQEAVEACHQVFAATEPKEQP